MSKSKAAFRLSMFQIGTPRKRDEGLRLGTVRYLPRGVYKNDYAKLDLFDVWLPILAPSRKLLDWLKERVPTPQISKTFFARYERELLSNTDARQVIQTLAALAQKTPISIGCYCEDEARCHRHVLYKVIKSAAK